MSMMYIPRVIGRGAGCIAVVLWLLGSGPAGAQVEQPAPKAERDEDFDDAPAAKAAGSVRAPRHTNSQWWRWALRAPLYPVRGAWWVTWSVPRLGLWAYDRYQVKDRLRSIFFNDTGTTGIFPVAFFETGFGLNVGGRLVMKDLFGHEEKFRVRASYGGQFRQLYTAKFATGKLFGDFAEAELISSYQIYPKSQFFGIGPADENEDFAGGRPLIDPVAETEAVDTRFRHDDLRVELGMLGHITAELTVRVSGAYTVRDFGDEADAPMEEQIEQVYDPTRLVGFEDGLSNIYTEVELTYDTRRVSQFYLSVAAPSTGWKLGGFAGYRKGIGDDPSDHFRWGADALRLFDLYRGDRVLLLRAYAEGVTGSMNEIAFVDLPRLGGPTFLRGYVRDRFRDRNVTLGTIEYQYPIERNFGGYLFVDAGRVWRELEDFELDNFRVGYGGGIQAHSVNGFLTRFYISSSIDGGLLFNLSFDPVFDTRSREESP